MHYIFLLYFMGFNVYDPIWDSTVSRVWKNNGVEYASEYERT